MMRVTAIQYFHHLHTRTRMCAGTRAHTHTHTHVYIFKAITRGIYAYISDGDDCKVTTNTG
jgi:hypothetical protein